jgi:hypothetical protein
MNIEKEVNALLFKIKPTAESNKKRKYVLLSVCAYPIGVIDVLLFVFSVKYWTSSPK